MLTLNKIEAKNLTPLTQYYYQFNVCDSSNKSPLGRTKTSPDENDEVSKISLAVFSCSNWQNGYFNAYGNAARKDNVDFFVGFDTRSNSTCLIDMHRYILVTIFMSLPKASWDKIQGLLILPERLSPSTVCGSQLDRDNIS